MAINGFPASIQNVIEQQNYLQTMLRRALHAKLVLRKAAAERSLEWFEARIGETKTFSRSNPLVPITTPLNPANNTGLDNGIAVANRSFEQWTATLNEWVNGLNLNILQAETLLADLFIDDMRELAYGAANSMEVVAWQRAVAAYDSGDTFATAAVTAASTVKVDNINGFLTAYANTNSPSYGLPQPVSANNKLAILVITGTTGAVVGSVNVTAVASDAPVNNSCMQSGATAFGQSGTLTLDANITCLKGDRIVAMDPANPSTTSFNPTYKDGAYVIRPLASGLQVQNAYQMASTNVVAPSVQIPMMVGLLSRRQVPRLRNGLYGCAVDATLLASFYQDSGFQIATQGSFDRSPVFTNGIIAKGWGVEFVEASQLPVYAAPAGGFSLRHAFAFGEDVISEHPFAGARNASDIVARMGDTADKRWIDRVEFVAQAPLDRLQEVVKMSYKYVGDFQPGTDKGSNPSIVFTSDYCRYKRGVIGQFASQY